MWRKSNIHHTAVRDKSNWIGNNRKSSLTLALYEYLNRPARTPHRMPLSQPYSIYYMYIHTYIQAYTYEYTHLLDYTTHLHVKLNMKFPLELKWADSFNWCWRSTANTTTAALNHCECEAFKVWLSTYICIAFVELLPLLSSVSHSTAVGAVGAVAATIHSSLLCALYWYTFDKRCQIKGNDIAPVTAAAAAAGYCCQRQTIDATRLPHQPPRVYCTRYLPAAQPLLWCPHCQLTSTIDSSRAALAVAVQISGMHFAALVACARRLQSPRWVAARSYANDSGQSNYTIAII